MEMFTVYIPNVSDSYFSPLWSRCNIQSTTEYYRVLQAKTVSNTSGQSVQLVPKSNKRLLRENFRKPQLQQIDNLMKFSIYRIRVRVRVRVTTVVREEMKES